MCFYLVIRRRQNCTRSIVVSNGQGRHMRYVLLTFCHFPSSDHTMADGTPGKSRRIWTRCPFCQDVVDMPSNHLDSYNKGCRGALEESGERKKAVMEKMRDNAYAFTAKQAIDPLVLEEILRARAAGPEARACMLDLIGKLNIKLRQGPSSAPLPDRRSSSDEEDDDKSQNPANDTVRGKEAPGEKSADDGAAAHAPGDGDVSKNQGAASNAQNKTHDSEAVTAGLQKLEVCSPNAAQQAQQLKPSFPRTPECKVMIVRSPEIDKVGLSHVKVAPICDDHRWRKLSSHVTHSRYIIMTCLLDVYQMAAERRQRKYSRDLQLQLSQLTGVAPETNRPIGEHMQEIADHQRKLNVQPWSTPQIRPAMTARRRLPAFGRTLSPSQRTIEQCMGTQVSFF